MTRSVKAHDEKAHGLDMNRLQKIWAGSMTMLVAGLVLLSAEPAAAEPQKRPEHEVKADYVPVFAQFVKWPDSAFASDAAPLVIGILGSDREVRELERAVKSSGPIAGRRVKLIIGRNPAELKDCHVLFICRSESAQAGKVLDAVRNSAVLTIGDTDGFASRGGIVNFFMEGTKVRFEINKDAADARGLKISSQLLALAKIIENDAVKGAP